MFGKQKYKVNIIPTISNSEIENFNEDILKNESGQDYQYFDNISKSAGTAKNSIEDYLAECVKFEKQANSEDYFNFLSGKMSIKLNTKSGIEEILNQYVELRKNVESATQKVNEAKETLNVVSDLKNKTVFANASEEAAKANKELDIFTEQMGKANPSLAEYATNTETAKISLVGYASQAVAATAKTIALTVATTALNAAFSFGISFIITAGISAIEAYINKWDNLREANIETANSFEETSISIEEQKDKILELQKILDNQSSTETECHFTHTAASYVNDFLYYNFQLSLQMQ